MIAASFLRFSIGFTSISLKVPCTFSEFLPPSFCVNSRSSLNSVYTRLSQNSTPNSNAANMHCCQK